MKKYSIRFLSILLSVLTVLMSLPLTAFASAIEAIDDSQGKTSSSSMVTDTYELIELRDEYVKHFKQPDGTIVAVQYGDPVHYRDENGVWQDIDNTIISSGNDYATTNGKIKFAKKITGNNSLFTLHSANYKIELTLDNAIKKTTGSIIDISEDETSFTDLQKMMTLDKLSAKILYEDILDNTDLEYIVISNNIKENIIVKKQQNNYVYKFTLKLNNLDAFKADDGSIVIFDPTSAEVIYNIPAGYMYDATGEKSSLVDYSLLSQGNGKYSLTITADNTWINDEKRVFPITIDPTVSVSTSSITDLDLSSASPDRSSPSDTTMYVSSTWRSYWKTSSLPTLPTSAYISSAYISLYSTSSTTNYVGVYQVSSSWDSALTWNQTIADTSPKGVLSSTLLDYNYIDGSSTDKRYSFDITSLVKSWYAGTASNYGVGFRIVDDTTPSGIASFATNDSTTVANRPQFVIVYKDLKGVESYWSFSEQSIGLAGNAYVNNATGALTIAKSLLSTTDSIFPYTPTITYNSSLAGKSASYPNSQSAYSSSYMPYGFKLNIGETIIQKIYTKVGGTSAYYYIWSDADGTEHAFFPIEGSSTEYEDEDGLQLKLTVSSSTCTIKDDNKTVKTFTKMSSTPGSDVYGAWYLSSISDKNNNTISFTFDNMRPTHVNLTPNGSSTITFLTIAYNSSNMPYIIWNSSTKEAIIFRYSSTATGSITTTDTKYLREVVYAHSSSSVSSSNWLDFYNNSSNTTNITVDGKASYTYNSSGYITKCKDELSGYEVRYTYSSGKVTTVQEYGSSSYAGQKIGLAYYSGYTEIRNSGSDDIYGNTDDLITRNIFDSQGRVVSAYSTNYNRTHIYGATTGEYETANKIKNNLKSTTVVGGSATNYLMNGGFEELDSNNNAKYWIKSSSNITFLGSYADAGGSNGANFKAKSGVTDTLMQYTKLPTGTYTLSMSVNAHNCKNVTANVTVQSLNTSANVYSEDISINNYYTSGTDTIFSMNFDAADYNSTGYESFKVIITVKGGSISSSTSASISIDNVMLEENIGNSQYSMIQMGNFDKFTLDSTGSYVEYGPYYWVNDEGSLIRSSAAAPFGYTGYVGADIDQAKYIKQRVYSASSSDLYAYDQGTYSSINPSTYIIAGFAKGTGQVASTHGRFAIRADVYYYNGSGNEDTVISKYFTFQNNCKDWQFVSGTIDINEYACIHYIDIVCEYSYQPSGYALFDNIAMIESTDDSVVKYGYYTEEDGNLNGLLRVKYSGYHMEAYEYNDDRQITRVANNRGEIHDYTYATNGVDISSELYYTFTPKYYPYLADNPDASIEKTPKTKTTYSYNNYGQLLSTNTYEVEYNSSGSIVTKSGTEYIYSSSTYITTAGSKIFGALQSETDSLGRTTRYYYDTTTGWLMATVGVSEGTGTCYTYDALGNLKTVLPCTYVSTSQYGSISGSENVSYTYNNRNMLETITTDTTTYTFTYDVYGNTDTLSAGSYELANYNYNSSNGKLNTIEYGNDFIVRYVYDELDNIKEVWYKNGTANEFQAYQYSYTSFGQLYRFDDLLNGRSTIYKYNTSGQLVNYTEFETDEAINEFAVSLFYNDDGQVSSMFHHADYIYGGSSTQQWSIHYYHAYLSDGNLNYYSVDTDTTRGEVDYSYDTYGRLTSKIYDYYVSANTSNRYTNTVSYTFSKYGSTRTSAQVATFTSKVNDYTAVTSTYTYDGNGNITKIALSTGAENRYVYDDLGQLIREDNTTQSRTYMYEYDDAGNILYKRTYALTAAGSTPTTLYSTYAYSYEDATWGDLLTSYRGVDITYDDIGNPLSYYNGSNYTFTWENGRRLSEAIKGSYTLEFKYNDEGLRTSKTVNGIEHSYYLSGSQIVMEQWGTNLCIYLYDDDGSPIGMQFRTNSMAKDTYYTFWFEKNLQGDIVAVYNESGVKVLTYTYDAWGNFTKTWSNSSGNNSYAQYNPFAYRGYYYDTELGMYYLQSRYYDPAIGRFISSDGQLNGGLLGYNQFAYCANNPVMNIDPDGHAWWHWALAATVVVACAVATVATCGGFAAAATAVGLVASGTAAATTASTVAAGAFITSSLALGAATLDAAMNSSSVDEFMDQGNWGTVGFVGFSAVYGGYQGYQLYKSYNPAPANGSSTNSPSEGTRQREHREGLTSPKKITMEDGTYTQYDNQGNIYSYTDFVNGKQNFRIDFQGKAHGGYLPHVHVYSYNDAGQPNGHKVYNIFGEIISE